MGQSQHGMLGAFRREVNRGIVGSEAQSTVRLFNLAAFECQDQI